MRSQESWESSVPLNVLSHYALLSKILASSSPEALVHEAAGFGYEAVGITEPRFFHLAETVKTADAVGIKPLIGCRLPFNVGGIDRYEVTLIARDEEAVEVLFGLASETKEGNLVTPELIEALLQRGNMVVLLRGDSETERDWLRQRGNYAFRALDKPDQETYDLAWWMREVFPEKAVVTHEVRTVAADQDILQVLARVKPRPWLAGIAVERLEEHRLMTARELAQLYRDFPLGVLARSQEISEDLEAGVPAAVGVKAKCVPEGIESFDYLVWLVDESLKSLPQAAAWWPEVEAELALVKQFKLADSYLRCFEEAKRLADQGIEFAVPGSAPNSPILRSLGVSRIANPEGLDRRVFLSEERKNDLPDVDWWVERRRVAAVRQDLVQRYQEAAVVPVVVARMGAKSWRKLLKAANSSESEALFERLVKAGFPFGLRRHPYGVVLTKSVVPTVRVRGQELCQWDAGAVNFWRMEKDDFIGSTGLERIARTKAYLARDGIEARIEPDDQKTLKFLFYYPEIGIDGADSPFVRQMFLEIGKRKRQKGQGLEMRDMTLALALARPLAMRSAYFKYLETGVSELALIEELAPIIGTTNWAIIFEEQMKAVERLRERNGENLEWVIKKLLARSGRYGYKDSHGRVVAEDVVYPQAFLAVYYPVHFGAAVLAIVAEYDDLPYSRQAYINGLLRLGVKFTFVDYEQMPAEPLVYQDKVLIGKNLLKGGRQVYEHFYDWWASGGEQQESVQRQIKVFDCALSHNPIILYPSRYRFNPRKLKQEIIALPIGMGRWQDKGYVLMDGGEDLFEVELPWEMVQTQRESGRISYWRLKIRKSEGATHIWRAEI